MSFLELAVNFACTLLPEECAEKSLSVEMLFDERYFFLLAGPLKNAEIIYSVK